MHLLRRAFYEDAAENLGISYFENNIGIGRASMDENTIQIVSDEFSWLSKKVN